MSGGCANLHVTTRMVYLFDRSSIYLTFVNTIIQWHLHKFLEASMQLFVI